jgi:hypothetical protein
MARRPIRLRPVLAIIAGLGLAACGTRPATSATAARAEEGGNGDGDACAAGECYYATFFSLQKDATPTLFESRYSHTFAAFAHVQGRSQVLERVEINWMPEPFHEAGRVLDISSTLAGVNWTAERTLAHAQELGRHVSKWGPVRIDAAMFAAASAQKAHLDAGDAAYHAYGRAQRLRPWGEGRALNCFQAIADALAEQRGLLLFGSEHGDAATRAVALYYRHGMIEPVTADDQVYAVLGFAAAHPEPVLDRTSELAVVPVLAEPTR